MSSPESLRARLLTLSEAAAVFRRSPRTLRDWVKDGALPVVKIGKAKYVRLCDAERLIAGFSSDELQNDSSTYKTIEQ